MNGVSERDIVMDTVLVRATADDLAERIDLPPFRQVDVDRFIRACGGVIDDDGTIPPLLLATTMEWSADGHTSRSDGLQPWDAPGTDGLPVTVVHGGARLQLHKPVDLASAVVLKRRIKAVRGVHGRRGPSVQITKESVFAVGETVTMTMVEDVFVLTTAERSYTPRDWQAVEDAQCVRQVQSTPVQLLQFTVATANHHRIHVDTETARREGFDDLAVPTGLHAAYLWSAVSSELKPGAALRTFSWRTLAPVSAGQSVALYAWDHADGRRAAEVGDGALLATAEAAVMA
jgi:hydroxyacyl-ACP dehydratase HTD2-like protein with hotdog domain